MREILQESCGYYVTLLTAALFQLIAALESHTQVSAEVSTQRRIICGVVSFGVKVGFTVRIAHKV